MNSIQSLQNLSAPRGAHSALTDAQNAELQNLLSNYDSDNVSDSDAKAIVEGIKDLGITSGKALGDALGTVGFDAKEIGQKGGCGGAASPTAAGWSRWRRGEG